MPHFFINENDINNETIFLANGETLNHLVSALRVKPGEIVKFIDENEIVYKTMIDEISKKSLKGHILEFKKSKRKLCIELCSLICVLKPEAMNLAIQNAVQTGAKEIYTVFSDNCAVKNINKTDKWQKIGMESFKQCERADIPKIFPPKTFEEVFGGFKKENIIVFAEKYGEFSVKNLNINKNEKILAVFGPEGGFSESEFEYFKKNNLKLATLGPFILKAPNAVTAGLFGLSQVF